MSDAPRTLVGSTDRDRRRRVGAGVTSPKAEPLTSQPFGETEEDQVRWLLDEHGWLGTSDAVRLFATLDATRAQLAKAEDECRKLACMFHNPCEHEREVERMREALTRLYEGTRNYEARGMGETLPVDYEMPPSTAKRVRKLIAAALARSEEKADE